MDIVYKEESYNIIGKCIEVHKHLGKGFLEVVYKDALEYEFQKEGIAFEREKEYSVKYKDIILPHKFYADFVVMDKIILEVKSCKNLVDEHAAQVLNYLAISNNKLGLLVNFGRDLLEHKRFVL
jgi:GxxExxY protein